MLTSKQRAYLRGQANALDAVFQIGKAGVTPELTEAVDEVLEKRELVKLSVLDNCIEQPGEIADMLSGRTRSETVQIIGRKIILYRKSIKKPVIELPKG